MKSVHATTARWPSVGCLPACLALALSLGSSLSPAAHAAPATAVPAAATALPAVSESERFALIEHMRRAARTPPPVPAASIVVTNCNDSGPGSYRQAVADAVSGTTIDLTATGCSTITLTTGDVVTSVADLTLQGPGALALSIDGGSHYRPIEHTGTGALHVNDLMISNGSKYLADGHLGNPNGGCVHSQGTVSLDHAWAKYCDAGSSSTTVDVRGGAVYGRAGVNLSNSTVSGSRAHSSALRAYGGGVFSAGTLVMTHSVVSGNAVSASGRHMGGGVQVGTTGSGGGGNAIVKYSSIVGNSANGSDGFVGGLYTTGNAAIVQSTIASNQSAYIGGMAMMKGPHADAAFVIASSTISGNDSGNRAGGVWIRGNPARISNSTIAFNTAHSGTANKYGSGLSADGGAVVDLQSTIIAGNTTDKGSGPLSDDVGSSSGAATLTGANNLIYLASSLTPPPGTIQLTDPQLKSLSPNGGPTSTHALSPRSPAINAGNNAGNLSFDQRGSGFARISGAAADIGAFELDLSDVIFASGFD